MNKIVENSGQASGYANYVGSELEGYSWYDDFSWQNLPWLLGSAFSEQELRTICLDVISAQQGEVRSRFPKDAPNKKLRGSATEIVKRLSKSEIFQLLLLVNDASIIAVIDSVVARAGVNIPSSEIRTVVASAETNGWNQVHCECSQLGVRVVSGRGDSTTCTSPKTHPANL